MSIVCTVSHHPYQNRNARASHTPTAAPHYDQALVQSPQSGTTHPVLHQSGTSAGCLPLAGTWSFAGVLTGAARDRVQFLIDGAGGDARPRPLWTDGLQLAGGGDVATGHPLMTWPAIAERVTRSTNRVPTLSAQSRRSAC
ncbi:MAG: hypothetical protein R2867_19345 [Caldilineaceae bacterium]